MKRTGNGGLKADSIYSVTKSDKCTLETSYNCEHFNVVSLHVNGVISRMIEAENTLRQDGPIGSNNKISTVY